MSDFFKFEKGNPNQLTGKAIIYLKVANNNILYAKFIANTEREITNFLNGDLGISYETPENEEDKQEEPIYSKGVYKIHDKEEFNRFGEKERIYLGEFFIDDLQNIGDTLDAAMDIYFSNYFSQKKWNCNEINILFEKIKYTGKSFRECDAEEIKHNLEIKLGYLMDSINYQRLNSIDDGIFDLKMFLRGCPDKTLSTEIISAVRGRNPKKLEIITLLIDKATCLKQGNQEYVKKVEERIKRLRGSSKDI